MSCSVDRPYSREQWMNSFECSESNGRPTSTVRLDGSRWLISSDPSASHGCACGRGSSGEQCRCAGVWGADPAAQRNQARPPPSRAAKTVRLADQRPRPPWPLPRARP
jgi:hypothetical protein